jgi:hypothetical protein
MQLKSIDDQLPGLYRELPQIWKQGGVGSYIRGKIAYGLVCDVVCTLYQKHFERGQDPHALKEIVIIERKMNERKVLEWTSRP